MYKIKYTKEAIKNLTKLKKQGEKVKLRKIKECIEKIQQAPRYPGLHTHKNESIKTYSDEDTFQSYVENKTPGAYRVFWHYGPDSYMITIISVTSHP